MKQPHHAGKIAMQMYKLIMWGCFVPRNDALELMQEISADKTVSALFKIILRNLHYPKALARHYPTFSGIHHQSRACESAKLVL